MVNTVICFALLSCASRFGHVPKCESEPNTLLIYLRKEIGHAWHLFGFFFVTMAKKRNKYTTMPRDEQKIYWCAGVGPYPIKIQGIYKI